MHNDTLKDALVDWTDLDIAAYQLALCLGVMTPEVDFAGQAKHVFWAVHPIGDMLYHFLDELVQSAILEKRDEPADQVRWNASFKESWQEQQGPLSSDS